MVGVVTATKRHNLAPPLGHVQIDWDHWQAQDLVFFAPVTPGHYLDLVSGLLPTSNDNGYPIAPSPADLPDGLGDALAFMQSSGSSSVAYPRWHDAAKLTGILTSGHVFTFSIWGKKFSGSGSHAIAAYGDESQSNHYLRLNALASEEVEMRIRGASNSQAAAVTSSSGAALPTNTWRQLVGRWAGDGDGRISVDGGAYVATTASTNNEPDVDLMDAFAIGGADSATNRDSTNGFWMALWNRAWTDDECDLYFEPSERWALAWQPGPFYFLPAAGATELIIADAEHGHQADALDLTQVHTLAIAESQHGHQADNLVLTQVHVLAIADAEHGHQADALDLTQVHTLVIADAEHGHQADNVVLDVSVQLDIADATHTHQADGDLTLIQQHVLAIADAVHTHSADNLELTQAHVLAIADALHAHQADQSNVFEPTGVIVETPSGRRVVVLADSRTILVAEDTRTILVTPDTRTIRLH